MNDAKLPKLKKCPRCGADGKLKVTIGGPCFYYAVHCTACNHNSRGNGNILPQLYSGDTPDSPQKTREDAYKAWNKIN
jgi:hypothetical protein